MAIATTTTYSMTAEQVIKAALRKLKRLSGDVPILTRSDANVALEELNILLKSLSTLCPSHVWKEVELKVAMVKHRTRYEFGTTADKIYSAKTRAHSIASAVSAATTIDVSGSTSDYATTDSSIDIHLNDGTLHTTTITNVASISGGVRLTLTTALDGALDNGAQIETYALDTRVPLRILSGFRVDSPGGLNPTQNEMEIEGRLGFSQYGSVRSDGVTYALRYERVLSSAGVPASYLHVKSESDTADRELRLVAAMPVYGVDALTDHVDIKPEHLNTLVYNLASQLLDNYDGLSEVTVGRIPAVAQKLLRALADSDVDSDGVVRFMPDVESYDRY